MRQLIAVCAAVSSLAIVATAAPQLPATQSSLQRYLARADEPPVEYRALRHLEASNAHFHASAWMNAWTEYDRASGFRFQIVDEGGNGYVRGHVLRAALEGEQKMWADHEPQRASITADNYTFEDRLAAAQGLAAIGVKPRRKDVLLIDGTIYVSEDGDLRRVEGRLSKTPSFWTRRVEITRRYDRIGGVRVPVSIESVAHVLVAGESTFKMTYQYETVNGQKVAGAATDR